MGGAPARAQAPRRTYAPRAVNPRQRSRRVLRLLARAPLRLMRETRRTGWVGCGVPPTESPMALHPSLGGQGPRLPARKPTATAATAARAVPPLLAPFPPAACCSSVTSRKAFDCFWRRQEQRRGAARGVQERPVNSRVGHNVWSSGFRARKHGGRHPSHLDMAPRTLVSTGAQSKAKPMLVMVYQQTHAPASLDGKS